MPEFRDGYWTDVPAYMVENAKQALAWREEYGRGMTDVGKQSAEYLAQGHFPVGRLGRAKAYLSRAIPNYGDKADQTEDDGGPTKAKIALHGWGSDGSDDALEAFSAAYEEYQASQDSQIKEARADSQRETFKLRRKKRTPEGFLDVWGVAASLAPLEYSEADPGGARVEMPTPEALKESAKSLKGVPVTLEHPEVGLLHDRNAKEYAVGTVMDAKFDEASGQLRVHLRIIDAEAVEAMERGFKRATSPGYRVTKWRETTPEEKKKTGVDIYQLARSHNHLAIVSAPRGEAPLRLDANGDPLPHEDQKMKNEDMEHEDMDMENEDMDMENEDMDMENESMDKYMDMDKAELVKMLMSALDAKDKVESKMDKMGEKFDAMRAKIDAMSAEIGESMDMEGEKKEDASHDEDEMKDSRSDARMSPKDFGKAFREHRRALEGAQLVGVQASEEEDTMRIKARVVQKLLGDEVRVDGESDTYIRSTFDMLMSRVSRQNTPSSLHEHVRAKRFDSIDNALDGLKIVSRRDQMRAYED